MKLDELIPHHLMRRMKKIKNKQLLTTAGIEPAIS
jgi:hypothetical protein